jgi:anti-sigma regulatory factor (Ser/Thr protein kinase)
VTKLIHDRVVYPPIPTSVSEARHFLETRLTLLGCRENTVRDAALLVSELAGNVVRHVATPFSVTLQLLEDSVRVEVVDSGNGRPTPRAADSVGGRGLRIVDAIAADWGVRPQLDGKAVYFTLPC